ncbi:hypothetical protein LGT41_0002985 [Abyssibius alkaniclasticus]|uniref:hypothetical protein n=1 Tax=Abyssibius alkaniclasticus TaxID=2881234 RepID=UPI0023648648|nr:hypothetical protein [Abyssibius alkaniclasticus]UPH71802.1 hypothetical protein LGT41_0002985 [Abyssibius alkaniclasticus]
MPPTAHKLLRPQPAATPAFSAILPEYLAARLEKTLGIPVAIRLENSAAPRPAALRTWLRKPGLKAVVDLGGPGDEPANGPNRAYCWVEEALAQNIVALRLGAKPARKPLSPVDHALCAALPEAVQAALARWLKVEAAVPPRFVTAPLSAPEAADWRAFSLALLHRNTPLGRLRLVVPYHCTQPARPSVAPQPARSHAPALHQAMQAAPLSLRAVLHRQNMAADALGDLRRGDMIALPDGCLGALQIALCDANATPIAQARLGAYDGRKVLKLLADPDAQALALPHAIPAE